MRGEGGVSNQFPNCNWDLADANGEINWDKVQLALLMDIRRELQTLNRTLACYRVSRMSDDINKIDRRLRKKLPLRSKDGR